MARINPSPALPPLREISLCSSHRSAPYALSFLCDEAQVINSSQVTGHGLALPTILTIPQESRVFFSRLGWPSGRSWIAAAILALLCLVIAWLFGGIGIALIIVLGFIGLFVGAGRRTEELAEKWSDPPDKR